MAVYTQYVVMVAGYDEMKQYCICKTFEEATAAADWCRRNMNTGTIYVVKETSEQVYNA